MKWLYKGKVCLAVLGVCVWMAGGVMGTEAFSVPLPEVSSPTAEAEPVTAAESACLLDVNTGKILFSYHGNKWVHPASTTKIVTLLTALAQGRERLEQPLYISRQAVETEPSRLGLATTDKVSVREALTGMMVVSGNDAAVAVAETLGGSVPAFADMMNGQAKKMGATHSLFLNPNGLTQVHHHTTAIDMARMAAYGMKNYAEFRDIVGLKSYTMKYLDAHKPKTVYTTNRFLRSGYIGADGIKTGYPRAAGPCLVASATRNGHTLIVALFNDAARWQDAARILDYGFRHLPQERFVPNKERRIQPGMRGKRRGRYGKLQRV